MSDNLVRLRKESGQKLGHMAINADKTKKGLASDIIENCKMDDKTLQCEVKIEGKGGEK